MDDRSLNRGVYQKLTAALAAGQQAQPLKILEIGCGIGTMVERLWDWELAPSARYTGIDLEPGLISEARVRLMEFARQRRLEFSTPGETIRLAGKGRDWTISLQARDFMSFCREQAGKGEWDLVLAHAFLDLVDLDAGLPQILSLLRQKGYFYFTLIFDGMTAFQPPSGCHFEDQVMNLYHNSMDAREGGGAGHSQSGRRVLSALARGGVDILAAGSSDWLVWPGAGGSYPAEEAYFLHYVLEIIHQVLASQPDLDQEKFQAWLGNRHAQVEAGELFFLAHQLDVCGRR